MKTPLMVILLAMLVVSDGMQTYTTTQQQKINGMQRTIDRLQQEQIEALRKEIKDLEGEPQVKKGKPLVTDPFTRG